MKIYLGSKAKHLSNASYVRSFKTKTPGHWESKIKNSRRSERFEARKAAENEAKDFLLSNPALFQFPQDSHYADAEDDPNWHCPDDGWQALDENLDDYSDPYHSDDTWADADDRLDYPQYSKDASLCVYDVSLPTRAVDQFMQGIHDFLCSDQKNAWVETQYGNIYIRKAVHHLDGRVYNTLDFANLDIGSTRQGIFTRLYNMLVNYLELSAIEAIYVENVMTQRFERKLLALGLLCQDFSAITPSYYKVIS